MEKEFMDFLKWVEKTPNVYLVLAGDLINNATKSSVSNCFEEKMRPSDQKKMMAKLLAPVKDRILCAVQGNHEARSRKDGDDCPLFDIMAKLDLEHLYRENMAFVKIHIGNNRIDGTRNPTYILTVVHGTGGGTLSGGSLNRNERFGYALDGVDALITAHTHKPLFSIPSKIRVNPTKNIAQLVPFTVLTATSWLCYGGYAAKKMLLPSSHKLQKMVLCGTRKEITIIT